MNFKLINSIIDIKKSCLQKEESIRDEFDLSPAEYNGLVCLSYDEKCSCSVLSNNMGLSYSRGSRVVDKMAEKGYVLVTSCTDDRRKCIVTLTAKGKEIKKKIDAMFGECEKQFSTKMSKAEIEMFLNSADKLSRILKMNN